MNHSSPHGRTTPAERCATLTIPPTTCLTSPGNVVRCQYRTRSTTCLTSTLSNCHRSGDMERRIHANMEKRTRRNCITLPAALNTFHSSPAQINKIPKRVVSKELVNGRRRCAHRSRKWAKITSARNPINRRPKFDDSVF